MEDSAGHIVHEINKKPGRDFVVKGRLVMFDRFGDYRYSGVSGKKWEEMVVVGIMIKY